MACILHTGVPGSGKTYLMINNLVKQFFKFDKNEQEYILKKEYENIVLISNVEGLKLQHKQLDNMIYDRVRGLAQKKIELNNIETEEAKQEIFYDFEKDSLRYFFDIDYQKNLSKKFSGPLVYVIEECHTYFDSKEFSKKSWCKDVLDYFRIHRHLGHSFFMDTQHVNNITPQLANLFECRFEAKPRSLNLGKAFKYNKIVDGIKTNPVPIVVRAKKEIFNIYCSMQIDESVKPKSAFIPIIIFLGVMVVLFFLMYKRVIAQIAPEGYEEKKEIAKSEKNLTADKTITNVNDYENWVNIPFVLIGDSLKIFNPKLNILQDVSIYPYPLKRVGQRLYSLCPPLKTSPEKNYLELENNNYKTEERYKED
jgi:zona occludens toxin (predicted ATPase)